MNTDQQQDYRLEKSQVRAAFEQVARRYDEHAVLQHEVGRRMIERLDLIRLQPRHVTDIGCGTGRATVALAQRYSGAQVVAVDLATAMLLHARQRLPLRLRWQRRFHYVCADAECLPLADACTDMVFSNLTLQWCNEPDRAFREFHRIATPGGLVMFSTFGPDTLKELRDSWRQVDNLTHVNLFMDMHDVGDALVRCGFVNPVMDVEHFTLTYPDVYQLMRDLKGLGAHNVTVGRPRGLTGKRRMATLAHAYQRHARDGRLPATYEVVYGHAWVPQGPSRRAGNGGVIGVPVDRIRRP
jgi:malonyl-CoA O-methyltransferase